MDCRYNFVKEKIKERLSVGCDDAFYVLSIDDVRLKYKKWIEKLPRVTPFYAVKCNDDERVLSELERLGAGFDCASKKEIKQILNLGVDEKRIIYAHTMKQESHLKYAAENHVMKMTFDSSEELKKIKRIHPNAKVVLRIRFDAGTSIICLGEKFGCDPIVEAPQLIRMCKDEGMNLIGICFHVGSGTNDYEIFEKALAAVKQLFDVAGNIGFKLKLVDIGGGFVGTDIKLLDNYANPINNGLEKYFPDNSVSIISEPGRYFVDSAFTLAVQITMKKTAPDGHIHYYTNDGIYMSFLISFIYEEHLKFDVIKIDGSKCETKEKMATVWGTSCNSKDVIIRNKIIPELVIGDWLVFYNMGAYTLTVSTSFNGFFIGDVIKMEA